MRRALFWQSILVWVILAVLTILYAIFREAVFIPVTGMDGTLARAVLLPFAIIYIFVITFVFLKKTGHTYSSRDTLMIGLLWLVLTIAFEFTFGTLVMGNSLATLLADYNIFAGRTWSIFLLAIFLVPLIVGKSLKRP